MPIGLRVPNFISGSLGTKDRLLRNMMPARSVTVCHGLLIWGIQDLRLLAPQSLGCRVSGLGFSFGGGSGV